MLLFPLSSAGANCTLQRVIELPVTMSGARPLVAARINDQEVRFIADSGAFYSLISPDMAAALKLSVRPTMARVVGIGGSAALGVATVRTFTLAGLDIPNVAFTVGGSSTGVAGLLGQNVLGFADVEYDLAGGAIRLFKPQDCGKAGLAYWAASKPFSMLTIDGQSAASNHTRATVEINGTKLRAIFDTGASRSIIDLGAAARAGLKPGDPGVERVGFERGLGQALHPVWRARFASFRIGDDEEVRNGWVEIGTLDIPGADMLIGADFFLSHRVYVSNKLHRLYLTYNGGPAFTTRDDTGGGPGRAASAAGVDNRTEPTDAGGFARRGAARAARGDLPGALADLDEAVRRAPDDPALVLDRARIRISARRPDEARSDLDHVVALQPANAEARMMRAHLELARQDIAGARADLDAASSAMAPQDAARTQLASLYVEAGAADRAVAQFTLWLDAHHEDSGRPAALNGRCWARALAATDLDKALDDCNAALRRQSGNPGFLDSRALVYLRRDDLARARKDYDAALAANPRLAFSLFGRAIAERRGGEAKAADADRAAAIAIEPDIVTRARRLGLAE